MSDQADLLRKLVRETVESRPSLAPGLPIIAFSGGVDQVGTSTLVWRISTELHRLGKQTIVVDANLERPSLASVAEVDPPHCLADVLNGKTSAKEALVITSETSHVLAGKAVEASPPELNRASVSRVIGELRGLSALGDVILVDVGSRMTPWMQCWWRAAQQVVLITSTREDSIKGAYANVKLASWGDADGKLKLIVNRCDHEESALRITERFASTCRRFLGVNLAQAAPIADCETTPTAYSRAVRLLATEIVSDSLVSSERIAGSVPSSSRLAALPENLAHSAKHAQHLD